MASLPRSWCSAARVAARSASGSATGSNSNSGEWRTWVSTSRASCLSPVPVAIAAETSASTVTGARRGSPSATAWRNHATVELWRRSRVLKRETRTLASMVGTLVLLADADASATGRFGDVVDIGDAHPCFAHSAREAFDGGHFGSRLGALHAGDVAVGVGAQGGDGLAVDGDDVEGMLIAHGADDL